MPTNYSATIDGAYKSISEKGIEIRIFLNETDNPPADADKPWEGSDTVPPHFDTFAVFLPFGGDLAGAVRPNVQKVLIPAKGLDFELTGDMQIQIKTADGDGTKYKLSYPSKLAPDPKQPIMYTCQAELWPY